jgi:hypothetical protein
LSWSGEAGVEGRPWSDGEGEFGEGGGEPVLRWDVGGEFVVAAPEILHEGMSGSDHGGRVEPFESAHRPEPGFEPAMICLDGVVGVLLGHVQRCRGEFVEDPQVCRRLVGSDLGWRRPLT